MSASTLSLSSEGTAPTGDVHVHAGNCLAWLASLPPGCIDLIVTDPAYESLEKHRAKGTTTRLVAATGNEWFPIFPNDRFPELFRLLFRAMAKDSHLYLICDQETMFAVKPMGEAAAFTFWKPIVWDKRAIGMGYHYRARCEFILFFEKGKRKLANLGTPDVLEVPGLPDLYTGPDLIEAKRITGAYPTQKPEELLRILIAQSSSLGQVVADPFMGSGATGRAARSLGRRAWGAEVKPDAAELARVAIESAVVG